MKIVGIILLVILCIVLFALLIVLFVPFRYVIHGESHEKRNASGQITWLLHLISYSFSYMDGDFSSDLRIIMMHPQNRKEDSVDSDPPKDISAKSEEENIQEENIQEEDFASKDTDNEDIGEEKTENSNKKNGNPFHKLRGIRKRSKARYEGFKRKLRKLKHNVRKYKNIIEDERNKAAVSHLWKEALYLLKTIKPDKMKLDGTFSAGTPDKTGQVLGIICMFPFGYRNKWKLYPDFETDHFYIDGETHIIGKIYGFQLLGILIRVLKDRNCRRLYHKLTN